VAELVQVNAPSKMIKLGSSHTPIPFQGRTFSGWILVSYVFCGYHYQVLGNGCIARFWQHVTLLLIIILVEVKISLQELWWVVMFYQRIIVSQTFLGEHQLSKSDLPDDALARALTQILE